jgi:hypothetical protein
MGTISIPAGVFGFFVITRLVLSHTTEMAALVPLMFLAIVISLMSLVLNVVALWKEHQLRSSGATPASFRLYAASAFISLAPLVIMIFLMVCLGAAQVVTGAQRY